MKLLIIGSTKSKESKIIKEETKKRNHRCKIVPLSKLIFSGDNQLNISTSKGENIADFEIVLFRAITPHIAEASIIAQYLQKHKRKIVDECLAKESYAHHKFFMYCRLWRKNIPQPPTFFIINPASIKKALEQIPPPFIVKHIKEMRGRNNFRFDTKEQVLDFFKKKTKEKIGNYLIQQWYPAKHYYRTLVLGNQVLGAIKRVSLHCSDRPQLKLKQRSKKTVLTPTLKQLSLKATRAMGLELAGLDIIPDLKRQLRVLEVNRSPRFSRFSRATGINVAQKIVEYLERKAS